MLIHIGYHKTASTFLQFGVFNDARLGFSIYPVPEVLPLLVSTDTLGFKPEGVRATLQPWLEAVEGKGQVAVLSHERLSGYPASGGFDSATLADRLCSVCPEARILIVIREQDSMIRSFYSQYVRDGGILTLRQFLTQRPNLLPARRVPVFSLDFYRYERLTAHYRRRFGTDRVLVLPFEQLQRAPESFLETIQRFAGVAPSARTPTAAELQPLNPSMPSTGITLQRWFNWAVRQNDLNPRPWLWPIRGLRHGDRRYQAVMTAITPTWWDRRAVRQQAAIVRGVIGNHFAASNKALADLTGLDLGSLGYRLP